MSDDRALRAYTDVLAVEWDADAGMARIVTLSDVYHAVPEEGMHLCPDREYHDVEICKHLTALEATRDTIDAPEGWLVVENLDDRTDPAFECEDCAELSDDWVCADCYISGDKSLPEGEA